MDDHEEARSSLARRLERSGCLDVLGATAELEEAAALLRREPPDIVLLDLYRRDRRGLEICRSLCELTSAPVVVFTSILTHKLWSSAHEAGAADYLLKQISTDRLVAELAQLVERHRRRVHAATREQ